jgi:protein-disulfide isomerase
LTTFEKLQKTYIKEGKVKYIVKNLPLDFHTLSKPAVYTVKCSGEQGKYWEMHAKIFTYQSGWAYSDDPYQEFITYADDLGLNLEKFTTCMKTGPQKYDKQINNNILEATSLGLSGTPSFVINGQILIGAQPLSAFTQIIDEELKKK